MTRSEAQQEEQRSSTAIERVLAGVTLLGVIANVILAVTHVLDLDEALALFIAWGCGGNVLSTLYGRRTRRRDGDARTRSDSTSKV